MALTGDNDPRILAWARRIRKEVAPMVRESAFTLSLVPEGDVDPKFCVELGMAIMMDKPLVLCVMPGQRLPAKLVAVADEIVECDIRTQDGIERLGKSLDEATKRMEARGLLRK